MIVPAIPADEANRLKTLDKFKILDTLPEKTFDDIVRAASLLCDTPVALITLVDRKRQWFKAKVGVDIDETPRDISFCGHTILQDEVMMVEDMLLDRRFMENPLVTCAPNIRFYVGAPLITSTGYKLGTLCVIDLKPRTLSEDKVFILKTMAAQVVKNLEMKQTVYDLHMHINEIHFMSIEIEEKNYKINESLNYAQRIQQALFPTEYELKNSLEDVFVYYKAKDIVGGDFYFHTKKGSKTYIAVGDCTGHGVPGALLSVMGINLLNTIIHTNADSSPEEILKQLNYAFLESLKQKQTEGRDGMDIALCVIDKDAKTVSFSGAKRGLFVCDTASHEITELSGDKKSIGSGVENERSTKSFSTKVIPIEENKNYYMFTDGYVDQFGEGGQKFMKKRMMELISINASRSFADQKMIFENNFNNWRGINNQLDDVLVLGFKL